MSEKLPGSSRRRGREVALQVLYALDLSSVKAASDSGEDESDPRPAAEWEADVEGAFGAVESSFELPTGARTFAHDLVTEVRAQLASLDTPIQAHSNNWRIERMAIVDRNILRLGAYELLNTDTPLPIVLNEAVDLARRFGSDPSPAFVNGILDALAASVREPEA
ncbi:MAG: transcription antitermination factor NusB [Myxococcota bacterium]|nr:transcription antitermination factor NusB [Myxococcota bacterium]